MRGPSTEVGFAAVSGPPSAGGPDLAAALSSVVGYGDLSTPQPGLQLAFWGCPAPRGDEVRALTRELRRRDDRVSDTELHRLMSDGQAALAEMMPSFGAVMVTDTGLTACTDALGFRHLYVCSGRGWAAVSTSARVLARLSDASLDIEATALQGMLGWQLGDRTLFSGVRKLLAGRTATLSAGTLVESSYLRSDGCGGFLAADQAVTAMRDMLRGHLDAYLDDYPDAVLQLTGGQDSRLLLSAVDPRRRPDLRVVTLGHPGDPDVDIAGAIAERYGMKHELLHIDGLEDLPACELYDRCRSAAGALELGADPLARTALDFAEGRALPGPRISGLGGEVARGFYYLGRGGDDPVTRARARRLAAWRMFANEAVETEALHPDFARWARESAMQDVHRVLAQSGLSWFAATDELYLAHRMQRWAGVTESAVCSARQVVNPMLDDRWIRTVTRLTTEAKSGSRFLARLQVALDEELAALPLDGRPPPATFATDSRWAGATRRGSTVAKKATRKIAQRLTGARRPPSGGDVVAAGVVAHWRAHPELLDPLARSGIVASGWVEELLAARRGTTPATVAFVTNLLMAQEAVATG